MSAILHDYLAGTPVLEIAQERGLSLREVLDAVRSEEAQEAIEAVRETSRVQSELFLQQSRGLILKRLLDLALRTRELGIDPSTPAGAFVLDTIRKACADLFRAANSRQTAGRSARNASDSVGRSAPPAIRTQSVPVMPLFGPGMFGFQTSEESFGRRESNLRKRPTRPRQRVTAQYSPGRAPAAQKAVEIDDAALNARDGIARNRELECAPLPVRPIALRHPSPSTTGYRKHNSCSRTLGARRSHARLAAASHRRREGRTNRCIRAP